MDCVIPGHSVRTFASAVQCLSKIGKDLYVDFDPLDGLTLRALNDAKSAFSAVEFVPHFFERCTAPTSTNNNSKGSRKRKTTASTQTSTTNSQGDLRFSCRVPMRALAPVVRPRKGIVSLRIKSEGHNADSSTDTTTTTCGQGNTNNASLQLAFEFELEISNNNISSNAINNNNNYKTTFCKVIHRTGVAEVDNIAAVAPKDDCSELVAAPKVLQRWLEPIQRSAEGCLIFTKGSDMVVATSFNSTDTSTAGSTQLAAAAGISKASLKTETSIHLEDLEDYDFQDHRTVPSSSQDDGDDGHIDNGMPHCPMPNNVNQEVVLVFGMKEAKALLQFCCHNVGGGGHQYGNQGWENNNDNNNNHHQDDHSTRADWSVAVSFHWAGRPLVLESKSAQGVSIQLVLATLNHSILKDLPMMQQRERSQQQQQQGRRQSS